MLNYSGKWITAMLAGFLLIFYSCAAGAEEDPLNNGRAIVEKALDYWRGVSSISRFSMTIHRPDFQRKVIIKGWTKGRKNGLFFVEKPAKDAGNGSLKKGRQMWSYNPKINRVIKLPPSMMSQSWMGSDFSNDDLAKSDSMLDDYSHTVREKKIVDGLAVYSIESLALEDAPVVWGKQDLVIREDGILLRQSFYDEDMVMAKEMTAGEIEPLGGRLFPKIWTMRRVDEKDHYTRLEYIELSFDDDLDDRLFTLASLKNRRH